MFESGHLLALADEHRGEFATATPFPHVVIDDFLPSWTIDRLVDEFPAPGSHGWERYQSARERKLASNDVEDLPRFTRHVLSQFNSGVFVGFMERLSGIEGLIPDPWFDGGGLHQIERGGYLKVHADFNLHPRLRLIRRLNAILYLNKDWHGGFGGDLELWNRDMTEAEARVAPLANRLIVFATTSDGYHGHPTPLACPEDRQRRSLAFYYYTAPSGGTEPPAHSTLFQKRPNESRERLPVKQALKRWVPPAAVDGWRAAKARIQERRVRRSGR